MPPRRRDFRKSDRRCHNWISRCAARDPNVANMKDIAFIGFGEAGQALAPSGARAYDILTDASATRTAKRADYGRAGVTGWDDPHAALSAAAAAICVVPADQALNAARTCAPLLNPGTLWLDMNSVAPDTKRAAAAAIEAAGGRYVDVALMSPVLPARRAAPLLVAGPHVGAALETLARIGFTNIKGAGAAVGDASAIKMIRSVMIKGIEALSAECILAAKRAGVADTVLASLDGSSREQSWGERVDYNLDRMLAHGLRRAAEMEEVAKTLEALGVDPAMTRGTIARQRAIGVLGIAPPEGLAAKLTAIDIEREEKAA